MLTRQGWFVAAGAVVLVSAGRLLGVLELFVLAAAAGALLAFSVGFVLLARLRVAVARDIAPPRVYAGNPSRVELTIRNDGTRRTPVLRLFDPVTGTRGAELLVGPLEPTGLAQAAYRLPTERRGIVTVGPLEVVVTDPFGLASSAIDAAPRAELTVFPHIDGIVPVPHTSGDDPHSGAEHPSALGRSGEDFYALRPYVVGDDLRRVHWPSTARRDELMVRQDELPWQGRVSVLLDVRRASHSPQSLELAVSAAASIVTASWKRRDLVRLATTDGTDFGFAAGSSHVEAMMEHLAVVQGCAGGTLRGMVDSLSATTSSGALVVVVGAIADAELAMLAQQRGRFGSVAVVVIDRSTWDAGAPSSRPSGGGNVVVVDRDHPFLQAWNVAMQSGRRRSA